jgi:peptidoglycan/xylan/chitin deacetylase (PgdA/CDA1 family)
MDDITAGMRWDRFDRFRRLFERHDVKPLIGIVPDNRNPDLELERPNPRFWDIMRELRSQGWSIAQHGYQHRELSSAAGILGVSKKSEFAGRPEAEQLAGIRTGRHILAEQGLSTTIWMAPWHSFDELTLHLLYEAGFSHVSDGYALFPYTLSGLHFVPCQSSRPTTFPVGVFTVCLHANTAREEAFRQVELFLSRHQRRVVSFESLLAVSPHNGMNRALERVILAARWITKTLRWRHA